MKRSEVNVGLTDLLCRFSIRFGESRVLCASVRLPTLTHLLQRTTWQSALRLCCYALWLNGTENR